MFLDDSLNNNLSKRTLAGKCLFDYSWYCVCLYLLFVTCDDMFVVCLYVNVTAEHKELSNLPSVKWSVENFSNDSYHRSGEQNKKKHKKSAFSGVDLLKFSSHSIHTHTHTHTHTYIHTYIHIKNTNLLYKVPQNM